MKFKTTKNIDILPVSGLNLQSKINGFIDKENLSITTAHEVLDGKIITHSNMEMDFGNIPKEVKDFSPINIQVIASDIVLSKNFVQKQLYSKNKTEQIPKTLNNESEVEKEKIVHHFKTNTVTHSAVVEAYHNFKNND